MGTSQQNVLACSIVYSCVRGGGKEADEYRAEMNA